MNRIIRIVIPIALIAVTLGVTNLPAVLPSPGFVVKLTMTCYGTTAYAIVSFGKGKTDLGAVQMPLCNDASTTATLGPTQKPDSWVGGIFITDVTGVEWFCWTKIGGTSLPATGNLACLRPGEQILDEHEVWLTISAPTLP